MEQNNDLPQGSPPQGPQFETLDYLSTGQWAPPPSLHQASDPARAGGYPVESPPQQPPKNKARARVYVAIGAVAVVAIIGVGVGISQHSANKVAAASASLASSTSGDSSATQTAQLLAWWNGGGSAEARSISAASTVMQAGLDTYESTGDSSSLRSACQGLSNAALQAELDRPALESVATPWVTAMGDFARAGNDCVGGIDSGDVSLLGDMVPELTNGAAALGQATTAVSSIPAGTTS